MSDQIDAVDPFEGAEQKNAVPAAEETTPAGKARRAAIEHGLLLGVDEATSRGEQGETAELRIRRAMAYAAWEFDGKPDDFAPYREEFKLGSRQLTASGDRAALKLVGQQKK